MARDMEQHAKDRAAELVHGKTDAVSALRDEVEGLEEDFDGDSYAPYYNQKQELIDEYEREFDSDAEDLCDQGKEYKASEYMQAMSAYADAIGYAAFQHYLTEAKDEFANALDDIEEALSERDLDTDDYQVTASSSDPLGWSAHDRELDTTNGNALCIHESGQLDGVNGISMRVWDGLWLSFTWSHAKPTRCNQCEALMINGVFCHETGCPNVHSRYDADSDTWIRQRKCFECGCTVDADDLCCSAPFENDAPEITTFADLAEREA